jgi:tRNA(Arg) A34 adenosine deaminase TadA
MQINIRGRGFAICVLLIDESGTVIHEDRNKMIGTLGELPKNHSRDHTSHAEQQLIYWYWENKVALNLPEPEKLTIVTTLDPCIMCASSIILSGFNVGTISLDDFGGVNWRKNCFSDFNFAPKIQHELRNKFGYYRIS